MDVINFQNSEIRKIIRPITARPKTAKNYVTIDSKNTDKQSIRESEESSSRKERITINSNSKNENNESEYSHKEKDSNMDFILSEEDFLQQKTQIEKFIMEENERLELISKQKEKMKNIDLIEKNVEEIYEWKSLFNKSRPITAYTHSHNNYKHSGEEDENFPNKSLLTNSTVKNELNLTHKNKNELIVNTHKEKSKPFVFPIALINEREEKIRDYITFHKNHYDTKNKRKNFKKEEGKIKTNIISNKDGKKFIENNSKIARSQRSSCKSEKDGEKNQLRMSLNDSSVYKLDRKNAVRNYNATRPQSVYAKRKDNEIFYLNQAFSDYFTQDLTEFVAKFPLLHPKIKCNNDRLRKTLNSVMKKEIEDEKLLETKRNEEHVLITDKHLNLAGNSKNIEPLLKSIYTQMYPSEETNNTSIFNSDSQENNQNKEKNNFSHRKKIGNKQDSLDLVFALKLETYNENDPDLKIFFKEGEKNNSGSIESNFESSNVDEESKLLKEVPEELIESFLEPDVKKKTVNENLEKPQKRKFSRRPQTSIERVKLPSYLRPKSIIYRNQSAIGKPRDFNFEEEICEINEVLFKQLIEKKAHKLNLLLDSHLPENTSTIVPYPSRTLPFKDKPGNQPFQYSKLKNSLSISKKSKESIMNQAIQIDNYQQGMNKKIHCDQPFEMEKKKERPNTSINFTCTKPYNLFGKIIITYLNLADTTRTMRNPSKNFEIARPMSKGNRVNYLNFNDYIDIQFREMNPNSKFYNSYKKEEIPYFTKTFNKNNKNQTVYNLDDIMKITNFKIDQRKVSSAKVKL